MKNLLITMSGGTTSVINATLAGLLKEAQKSDKIDRVYAGYPGIVGFMSGKALDITDINESDLEVLKSSPGSASIGTTRTKIFDEQDLQKLSKCFEDYNIGYFVNIGGNGTIKQTKSIGKFINNVRVAAAPKTVDNDLGDPEFEDLWFTPGFPSCVNYWFHKMHMLNKENLGASTNDKVLIAQTFGRETGFIVGALRAYDVDRKLPIILLIPEDQQSPTKIISRIDDTLCQHGRAIIGICEGYKIRDYDYSYDLTGQKMYGSSSSSAMQQLINLCIANNIQARGYNPTVDQRQNFNYTVQQDLDISYELGQQIIKNFMANNTHFFQSYSKFGCHSIPLSDIGDYSREMKKEWIDDGGFDVTDKYTDYLAGIVRPSVPKSLFVGGQVI